MKRKYWLQQLGDLCFAPVTLDGDILIDESSGLMPDGQLIGTFWEDGDGCAIAFLDRFASLFEHLEIPRTAVESSNIISIGHDPRLGFLDVEFKGGAVYRYNGVPDAIVAGFMAADSKGKYLAKEIKGKNAYFKVPNA